MNQMEMMRGKLCSCGKVHDHSIRLSVGAGVLQALPDAVAELGGTKVFILSDKNTFLAAGEQVCRILEKAGIPYCSHSFTEGTPEPDEKSVGSAMMHFDKTCDLIIGVGSGVINDIGKILSHVAGCPYIIVGTAPSMDGYASASSSMTMDGLKISLPSRCPDMIIGDTDILCNAPLKMMRSGLGDMLAKYVSICEWRISHLITGEYYCEEIAQLIRQAVRRCVDNAQGLMQREEGAVRTVFEGLIIAGTAMKYAGLSRPASGVEHYISHVLDMRGAQFHIPVELHGIQCAVGTLIAVRLYEKLKAMVPEREKALAYAGTFDVDAWHKVLRTFLGDAAESMIRLERKEKKYDKAFHEKRLEIILSNWDTILQIIEEELPDARKLEELLDAIGLPKTLSGIGADDAMLPTIFCATKDIRDKYVLSRLAWDLGLLDQLVETPQEHHP